ncbi:hypothetical protein GGTG_12522 [Gaeumannomyces tritici R3-111a-1]|uniref:Protein SERAC1 n=1 Tax=Gaeumannomyces tritici (strain R3-111a-1) TaxID=644352 RepID=J3PG98_GAET3|nr:hypothetical protein GGTG_12522 [Gaeumannomyces tritici R3-111a-1]EJT69638.1 hypothetical protein GGTG_12522 [Gaeumannomyces tritici R3-111a-1]
MDPVSVGQDELARQSSAISDQPGTKRLNEVSDQGPDGPLQKRARISPETSANDPPGEPATSNSTAQHGTNRVTFCAEEKSQSGADHSYSTGSTRQCTQRGVRLSQVHPKDKTETDIDIIAIHGLDTKSPDTWSWVDRGPPEKRVNWLQDPNMLPGRVERARIFTCDWPADLWQPSDLVQKTEEELALLLLDGIQRRPPATSKYAKEDRPILFIASCLGGIILMKALVDAAEKYRYLRRATRGILFLATPFRGTSFQEVAAWAERCLKAQALIRAQEVNKLLDSLKGSTSALESLVRKFTHLCQRKDPPCLLFNFYELGKTSLPRKAFPLLPSWLANEKLLVDTSSATLDIVQDPLPLDRPHVLMNKFPSPDCLDYDRVAGQIQKMLADIREGSPLEQADAWIRDNIYNAGRLKIERLSGDQLPMDQCYINLAIVEQPGSDAGRSKEGDKAQQSSPFTLQARLKVETPDKNIQVELPTIFNPRKRPYGHTTQPRRILIRGRAGVGKTTLCKKIVHEFAHGTWGEWSQLFDRVLWVPLRTLKSKPDKGYNLEGLFLRDFFCNAPNRGKLAGELEEALHTTQFGTTLFVLDGLDEVSEGLDADNEMCEFLKFLLNQPNVIITSRPYGKLLAGLRPLDVELETIGFYPDQVTEYIGKALHDPQKLAEIQSFLQQRPLIHGLVRIPIQLDALCFTWDEGFGNKSVQTMTSLYQAIEHRLWKKDILRLEKTHEGTPIRRRLLQTASRATIENFVKDEIYFLECLAFAGLHNDTIDYGSEHRNAIADRFVPTLLLDKTLPRLSFLRTSDPSAKHSDHHYHFLHLTFQEYFAARNTNTTHAMIFFGVLSPACFTPIPTNSVASSARSRTSRVTSWVQCINAAEMEFPEHILGNVLQKESEDVKEKVLHSLMERPNILPTIMDHTASCLGDNVSKSLKTAVLHVFKRLHKALPNALQDVAALLKDPDRDVRSAAAEALGGRSDLPEAIFQDVAALLKDPDWVVTSAVVRALCRRSDLPEAILQDVAALLKDPVSEIRSNAVWALGWRSDMPEATLQDVAALLKDPDRDVRSAAAAALSGRSDLPDERFYSLLIKMDFLSFNNLYQVVVERSFSDNLICRGATGTPEQGLVAGRRIGTGLIGVLVRTAYAVDLVGSDADAADPRRAAALDEVDQTNSAMDATNDAMDGIPAAGSGEAGEDDAETALVREATGRHLLERSKMPEGLKSVRRIWGEDKVEYYQ